MSDYLG